eukprot:scaffold6.g2624.t1
MPPLHVLIGVAVLGLIFQLASCQPPPAEGWQTRDHAPGKCATYGICGHRPDGDVLSCPNNTDAQPLGPEGLARLQDIASIFLVGCPACNHNFKHFFCLLTCSPDQATFANVTAVQQAPASYDPGAPNVTAVAELSYFVSDAFGRAFYNSCADVVYPVMNQRAMQFVGGGAHSYQEWFAFLGLMNFPPEQETPEGMAALDASLPACGDAPLACSCGDCPAAPGCQAPLPPPPPPPAGCPAVGAASLTCGDLSLAAVYAGFLACLPFVIRQATWELGAADYEGGEVPGGEERGAGALAGARRSRAALAAAAAAAAAELQRARGGQENGAGGGGAGAGGSGEIQAAGEGGEEWKGDGGGGGGGLATEVFTEYPAAEQFLRRWYYWQGRWCAAHPWRTLGVALALVAFAGAGLARLRVMTSPEELWVGPGSQAAQEKAAYEAAFGPFYRITQLVVTTTPRAAADYVTPSGLPAVVSDVHIRLLFDMQAEIDSLTATVDGGGGASGTRDVRLGDVCLRPLGDACATQSVLQYWQMSRQAYAGVLGGFPANASLLRNYTADATAFVVTLPLDPSPAAAAAAQAWEAAFVELAGGGWGGGGGGSAAMAGDVLVHSRVGLGFGGVLIVAGAVVGALGLCGWVGLAGTLIIMEVIPFLALAVGVDNMFILAHALHQQPPSPYARDIPHCLGLALAAVGPSITLAAACEVVAFSLGALTSMPALRNFSACAALALALDFALQVTAFVALLALDTARVAGGRLDCLPWRRVGRAHGAPLYGSELGELTEGLQEESQEGEEYGELEATYGHGYSQSGGGAGAGSAWWGGAGEAGGAPAGRIGVAQALQWYMRRVHAPLLRRPAAKAAVLAAFAGLFLVCAAALPRLERGLDQAVALPRDSYLQQYYRDVLDCLRVGPPLMLVVRNLNVSEAAPDVNRTCSVSGCDPDSLLNRVTAASRASWATHIATPAASWLDDYLAWVSPEIPQCCRAFPDGTRCPPPDQPPCAGDPGACAGCRPCFGPGRLGPGGRPGLAEFRATLPWFLESLPSKACAKGGAGAYSDAVQRDAGDSTGVAGLGARGVVSASSFRTNYVVLSKQADFIGALQSARDFAAAAAAELGVDVFSFSPFHIFFEQYLTIDGEALVLLGCAAVAVFLICLFATGSPWAASVILATLGMLLVDLAGVMKLWGMQLNAVSLVNLVMSLGIGVEFCAHIMHAFMEETRSAQRRADAALEDVGAAVLSGITLTKFVGVAVYYFRFYLALVLLGAAHGLVFLPVLLACFGPEAFAHWRWRVRRHLGALGAEAQAHGTAAAAAAAAQRTPVAPAPEQQLSEQGPG